MPIARYLDITSAGRDRTQFPNPFDFQCSYTNLPAPTDPSLIADATSEASPYDGDVSAAGGLTSTTTLALGTTASSVAGSYVGEYLELYGNGGASYTLNQLYQRVVVTSYNATTKVATFAAIPATYVGQLFRYIFRHKPPAYQFSVLSSTIYSVTVAGVLSDTSQYIGKYLQPSDFTPNELWDESKKISSVSNDGTNTTFTITPSPLNTNAVASVFSAAPTAGYPLFILNVMSTAQPLIYSGTTIGNQVPRCFNLTLGDFIISGSQVVYGHPGGAVSTYPYLYLEIQAESQRTSNILTSNNPHSRGALFKIATSSDMITSFFNLRSCTSQTIKFKPNDSFTFRVLRPDGTVLRWVNPDTMSPYPPDPTYQISFTISYYPANCSDEF